MCLDFPAILTLPIVMPSGTVTLPGEVPCDDNLIGLKLFAQFVAADLGDPINNKGISNQDELDIVAPGGMSDSFLDFSNVSKLQLNGTTTQAGNVLRLTTNVNSQGGTAFYKTSAPIDDNTSFRTTFVFNQHGTRDGADGMTFMIQGNDEFVVGVIGSGLAYQGIKNSLAVEMDSYKSTRDPNGNHLAVLTNGNVSIHYGTHSPKWNVEDENDHRVWIEYCGPENSLDVYVSEDPNASRPNDPVIQVVFDLHALVGDTAWLGFSAATGGLNNNHDVISWDFVIW